MEYSVYQILTSVTFRHLTSSIFNTSLKINYTSITKSLNKGMI